MSDGNEIALISFNFDVISLTVTGECGKLTGDATAESPFFFPTLVNPFLTNGDGRDTFFSSSSLLSLSGAPRNLMSTNPPFFLVFALNATALSLEAYAWSRVLG